MAKRFTFYGHPRSAPTYRVGLALSMMQEPFAFEIVDLPNGGGQKPEYKAKSRFGQVPCLQDGSDTIIQSSAILEHLADATGKLGGKTAIERAKIREWMYWDFDRLCPGMFRSRAYTLGFRKGEQAVIDAYKADGAAGLAALESWLSKNEWLANGRPTIADISLYPGIYYAADGGFDLSKYPGIAAWKTRFEALPGYGKPTDVIPAASRA
jgi:glutathione S-transferase